MSHQEDLREVILMALRLNVMKILQGAYCGNREVCKNHSFVCAVNAMVPVNAATLAAVPRGMPFASNLQMVVRPRKMTP